MLAEAREGGVGLIFHIECEFSLKYMFVQT